MSIVKISNKKSLESLQAKLTLRLGILANQKFEEIIQIAMHLPMLNPKRAQKIIEDRNELNDIPYNADVHFDSENDQDIYNS